MTEVDAFTPIKILNQGNVGLRERDPVAWVRDQIDLETRWAEKRYNGHLLANAGIHRARADMFALVLERLTAPPAVRLTCWPAWGRRENP